MKNLKGTGYPYKLTAPEIPVQTRMMTISDIFDALAAADRPYKKAFPLSARWRFLNSLSSKAILDAGLFEILPGKIYQRWKTEPISLLSFHVATVKSTVR